MSDSLLDALVMEFYERPDDEQPELPANLAAAYEKARRYEWDDMQIDIVNTYTDRAFFLGLKAGAKLAAELLD